MLDCTILISPFLSATMLTYAKAIDISHTNLSKDLIRTVSYYKFDSISESGI
jgi:hypothetical protein